MVMQLQTFITINLIVKLKTDWYKNKVCLIVSLYAVNHHISMQLAVYQYQVQILSNEYPMHGILATDTQTQSTFN